MGGEQEKHSKQGEGNHAGFSPGSPPLTVKAGLVQ